MERRTLKIRYRFLAVSFALALFSCATGRNAETGPTPLELLKEREWENRDNQGEVYLGKILTVSYKPESIEVPESKHPYILELTDVIKTPLRSNYRLVLRGLWKPGEDNKADRALSLKQAEKLKQTLIKRYYMGENRIFIELKGPVDPEKIKDTAWGRSETHIVEIHVYGNVSKAVRFVNPEEEAK
jgi:hypothetical protein